jgi:hypothetical protein
LIVEGCRFHSVTKLLRSTLEGLSVVEGCRFHSVTKLVRSIQKAVSLRIVSYALQPSCAHPIRGLYVVEVRIVSKAGQIHSEVSMLSRALCNQAAQIQSEGYMSLTSHQWSGILNIPKLMDSRSLDLSSL